MLEGEWWPPDYAGPPLVSIEEEVAMETGLGLGDRLQFEIAGQVLEAEITSVRRINWDSFMPNFFLVLSPGALDEYPATFIASMRVQEDEKRALVDLVREHPTISVIDLDSILQQVRSIIEKASLAVQAVFFFTLAAGDVVGGIRYDTAQHGRDPDDRVAAAQLEGLQQSLAAAVMLSRFLIVRSGPAARHPFPPCSGGFYMPLRARRRWPSRTSLRPATG